MKGRTQAEDFCEQDAAERKSVPKTDKVIDGKRKLYDEGFHGL
jgi:regulator of replication initiation timing